MALTHFLMFLTISLRTFVVQGQSIDELENVPHPNYNGKWYEAANDYVVNNFRKLTVAQFEEFEDKSAKFKEDLGNEISKVLKVNTGTTFEEVSKVFREKNSKGEINTSDVSKTRQYHGRI